MALRKSEEFLNFFWYLAENDDSERTEAVIGIIKALKSIDEDEDNKDLEYTVERLVRGLTSERKCARLGFCTALTVLLKSFEDISIENVLQFGDKHLKPNEKNEKRNCVIGQVLLITSIIRSGRQLSDDQLSLISKKLLHVGQRKFYLEVLVTNVLTGLLEKIDEKEFTEIIFPVFQDTLSCGWESSTPFNVWLIFFTARLFPNVINKSFLKANWGYKTLMKAENFDHLAQIMMKSTLARPKMHSVCTEIVTAAKKSKNFAHFWTKIIDSTLIPCGKDKIYLTFELIKFILPQLKTADEVKLVLTPKFIRQFIQNLSHRNLQLYSAAQNLAEFFITYVSTHENSSIQSTIVQQLLTKPGTISFDKITKTKTISTLLTKLKTEALDDVTQFFMDYISGGIIDGVDAYIHREAAAKQLENLFRHKSLVKNWDWKKRVICFFVQNAFFDAQNGTENPIRPELHSYLSSSLIRIFGLITKQTFNYWKPNVDDLFTTYYEAIKLCDNLLKDSTKATPVSTFDDEVAKHWKRLWKVAQKLRENNATNDAKMSVNRIFEILYLQLMLQLMANPMEIIPFIEEIESCYEEARDDENEPSWVQVLIDITLSFVSKHEQKSFQCIVETIIHLLAPRITVQTVKQILNVISPHDQSDVLVDEDEDDESDDDDDAETNENDNDASSEDSSSSDEDDRMTSSGDQNEKNLEKALKTAFDDDSDESDVDLDAVDESELVRKDEIFAELLRMKKKKNNVEAENRLRIFKLRCINLLNVIVDVHPTIPVICSMIVPILEVLVEFGFKNQESRVLHLRAEAFLRHLVNQKNFEEAIDENEKPDFIAIWHQIVEIGEKVTNLLITKQLADAITLLTRCMKKWAPNESVLMNELVANYKVLLQRYFAEGGSRSHISFISSFLDKNLDLAGEFLIDIIDFAATDDVRLFKKTQGLGLIVTIMNHAEVLKNWDADKWQEVYAKLDDCVRKSIKNMGTEKKPAFASNLFKVYWSFYQRCVKIVKKPLPVISASLTKPLYHKLNKDTKKIVMKLNQLNPCDDETMDAADTSPNKKSKKRKREAKQVAETVDVAEKQTISTTTSSPNKKKRKHSKPDENTAFESDKTLEICTQESNEDEKSSPKRQMTQENDIEKRETASPKKKRKSPKSTTATEEKETENTSIESNKTPEICIDGPSSEKKRKSPKPKPAQEQNTSIESDKTLEIPNSVEEMSSPKRRKKHSWELGKTEISIILGENDQPNIASPRLRSHQSPELNMQNGIGDSTTENGIPQSPKSIQDSPANGRRKRTSPQTQTMLTLIEEVEVEEDTPSALTIDTTPIKLGKTPARRCSTRKAKLNGEKVSPVTLNDIISRQTNGVLTKRRITVSESSQGSETSLRRSARIQSKNKL